MNDEERPQPEEEANSRLSRRQFLTTVGTGAAAAMLARYGIRLPAQAADLAKPNFVLILADDLGYGELGCQGLTKDIPTPNIDSIARNGVRFTDGHVSCPVCAPTRAGLMTGRYQERFGLELNPGPPQSANPKFGLIKTETTIAERLKPLGYATGMFGKWHIGYQPGMQPPDRGFDEFFGFLGGAHDYLNPLLDSPNPIMRGREKVTEEKEYLTDALAREAVSFIERHKDEPFFCYLPFNAVHAPLQATEKYLDRFKNIADEKRRTFAAMLSAMDDGVGRVLAKLREHKLEQRTLVFFISDNGGPTRQTSSGNGPLHGFKGQVYEGGHRVPFMVQWKGQLPAGKVYRAPVIALDVHPTIFAAAGGKLPADAKLDGVNLLPYLRGEKKDPPHDRLFWRFGQQWAIRIGDWKLLGLGGQAPELYNLKQDLGEKRNLAASNPDKAKELQTAYDAWAAELPPAPTQGRAVRRAGARAGNRAGNRPARRNRANTPAL